MEIQPQSHAQFLGSLRQQQYLNDSAAPAPPAPPAPPPPPPPPERHTISEDRSAGSNLEARNLAALVDRAASQDLDVSIDKKIKGKSKKIKRSHAPDVGEMSMGLAQPQQRFGQLLLDEQAPSEHVAEGDHQVLRDGLFVADSSASHDSLQPHLVAKIDWVEDIAHIKPDSGLQANIEMLRRNVTEMQKELSRLDMQKQMYTNKQFQILYRIEDTCYFDHPEWTQRCTSIVSRMPVKNLDLFLEKNKNVAFIVYRDFEQTPLRKGAKNKQLTPLHIRESIRPVNRQLRKTLQMMLQHDWRYEAMFRQLRRKKEIDAPYLFVYHHRAYWKDMLAQCPDTAREHLNLFAFYVSENYGQEYMAADALFARRKVSAGFIKYLFQPGDILVSRSADQYRGLVARSWPQVNTLIPARGSRGTKVPGHDERHFPSLPPPPPPPLPYMEPPDSVINSHINSEVDSDSTSPSDSDVDIEEDKIESSVKAVNDKEDDFFRDFLNRIRPGMTLKEDDNKPISAESLDQNFEIETWQWDFDGAFKRFAHRIVLRLPESTAIDPTRAKEWNMQDLDVYPLRFAPQSLVQRLRCRGMMFWRCRKRCLVSYHESNTEAQDESAERFMIDFLTFQKLHSKNTNHMTGDLVETMPQAEMEPETPPDKAFYYLAPLKTKGFNLRTKKWLDLDMDRIGPVVWNEKAFDSLVLDKARKTKELITALVSKQISSSKSTDVIAGKGNGLILLLHGGPGTGKTLTAEGVAEIAKKPLYRVTCGDVGTKAEDVENYLESVLYLGKLWDCVVLLDEAEVFLERRSLDDLQRNALVSVFLRVIEYQEGILILTSNRVGTFDEAFRSRIQIAVHYPPLRAYQRLQIWRNFFDRLESFKDGSVDVDDLRDHLEKLQDVEINGRQIRNAITTARQYAEWKGIIMNYEHLKIALDVAADFDNYSEKLRGGLTDDQIAEDEGIR